MNQRITPEIIKAPGKNWIVTIGTNESGHHGAGMARLGLNWGLKLGQGYGHMGSCFGIPTKDWEIQTLSLDVINFYVQRYVAWTKIPRFDRYENYVTLIGCGLAGYTPADIAPMFADCLEMENFWLPKEFIEIIEDPKRWRYIPLFKAKNYYVTETDRDREGNTVGY